MYFDGQFKIATREKHIVMMGKRNKRDKNNNAKHSSKRQKRDVERYGSVQSKNYNELFPIEEENSISNRSEAKGDQSFQNEDIISTISQMSETITFLTEKLVRLSEEVRYVQNNPVLKINSDDVPEEDILLLKKFESFELPIVDRFHLESLENDLMHDQSFNTFFVSINIIMILAIY